MPSILYIYEILVGKYQYSIYTIYIYIYIIYTHIILYPLKYMKQQLLVSLRNSFCPILNCLNILQPYSEDTKRNV